jgi:threonine dehydrogenase-like Zn-dependent dehydrogenase
VRVIGLGGIGSTAVLLARSMGARVVAASRGTAKLALAAELGAAETVRIGGAEDDAADDAAARRRAGGGDGPDVVVQCAGSAAADELAIAVAGPGGRVVLLGATEERFGARSVDLIWRELSVTGSRGFTARDIVEVLDRHAAGELELAHLTASVRPLDEANEALEDLRAGRVLRSVLRPDLER